ncbi:MAG: fatty acid cis/trans isomerase, partial [Chromatiales bacterium]
PNFFFELDASDVDAFAEHFASITDRKGYEDFVGLYGMRRTNETFWGLSDWFQEWALDHRPLQAGIYDLNRYRNR